MLQNTLRQAWFKLAMSRISLFAATGEIEIGLRERTKLRCHDSRTRYRLATRILPGEFR